MEHMWLYTVSQCVVSVSVLVVSVRMCVSTGGGGGPAEQLQGGPQGPRPHRGSVSASLRLCLGWVGALGGALGIPVSVLLNLRSPQCLYTCITLVCCPLLVRQFTMYLLLLLSLDTHLQYRLAHRYSSVVTRRRALCAVLLCWMASVVSSFAQFIVRDAQVSWGQTGGQAGQGLQGNGSTTPATPPPPPRYPQGRSVIGKDLPYGGFLSKFYVEDSRNFTYAEIHGSHWEVCAQDTVLSPQFLVYVYGVTVFLVPALGLLTLYLDLLCHEPPRGRCHALSLCLLVLLCLPLHITHAMLLFSPGRLPPFWACPLSTLLSQLYGLVPPLLHTPRLKQVGAPSAPLALPPLPPAVAPSRGKAVGRALREAVQGLSWALQKGSCVPRCDGQTVPSSVPSSSSL
ncbi:uncharacterized protein FYW47_006788 [Aplochiton taeniatus]